MNKNAIFVLMVGWLALGCNGKDVSSKTQLYVSGQEVECGAIDEYGDAPGAGDTAAELECTAEFFECSDGRKYTASCRTTQGSGSTTCTCSIDSKPTDAPAFEVDGECGIDPEDVTAGCGWSE